MPPRSSFMPTGRSNGGAGASGACTDTSGCPSGGQQGATGGAVRRAGAAARGARQARPVNAVAPLVAFQHHEILPLQKAACFSSRKKGRWQRPVAAVPPGGASGRRLPEKLFVGCAARLRTLHIGFLAIPRTISRAVTRPEVRAAELQEWRGPCGPARHSPRAQKGLLGQLDIEYVLRQSRRSGQRPKYGSPPLRI